MFVVYLLFSYRDPLAEMGNRGYVGAALTEFANSVVIIFPTPAPAYTFAMWALFNPVAIGGLAAASGEMIGYYLSARGQTTARRGTVFSKVQELTLRF